MHTIRRIATQSALVIGAVLVSASIQTLAFTDTSATPPNNDAYAPLTTSDTAESKVAGLTLNTGGAATGLIVNGAVRLNNAAAITCGGKDGVGAGAIRYNAGALELCDGSTWKAVGSSVCHLEIMSLSGGIGSGDGFAADSCPAGWEFIVGGNKSNNGAFCAPYGYNQTNPSSIDCRDVNMAVCGRVACN